MFPVKASLLLQTDKNKLYLYHLDFYYMELDALGFESL